MQFVRKTLIQSISTILLAFAAMLMHAHAARAQDEPRNVILFIADGFGPASATFARDYIGRPLTLDTIAVGSLRTHSTDSRVTDSAAAATALAAGIKTYNGAIGMDTLRRPVGTLLEAAEAAGLATGLVSTASITHATPASFSAHVPQRDAEVDIAVQQIEKGIEVMFGGGRQFFLPVAEGGVRQDHLNVLDALREREVRVITTHSELDDVTTAPVVGLFTMSQMSYEIDRDPAEEPGLTEMTRTAIELLKNDPDGFFLMVEGGRIDHAAHGNDPAGHLHDILAYDEAVAAALKFAVENGETLVVSVADHETGGLSLGRNVHDHAIYDWRPEVLERVTASTDHMSRAVADGRDPAAVLAKYAGIDTLSVNDRELLDRANATGRLMMETLGEIISRRALVGWTTYGHTGVDVTTYAYGPGSDIFRGNQENTAVGLHLAELLGLDLYAETRRLRAATRE